MHFVGSDLDLKGLACRADEGCVQGLIHVCLGHGNVVLEPARDGLIHLMNGAEHCIAVPDRADDHADSKEIVDLLQRLFLVEHLAVDAEEMFDTSVDLALNAGFMDMMPYLYGDLLDVALTLALSLLDLCGKIIIDIGIQILE